MEQTDHIELLKSYIGYTIKDIECISEPQEVLIKITFNNNESLVLTGDFDIYVALSKNTEFH